MHLFDRRRFLSLGLPAVVSTFGGGVLSLLPVQSASAEAYSGAPETIGRWMQKWMGKDRTTKGILRLARFADPTYILTDPIEWRPTAPDALKYQPVIVPKYFVTDLASVPQFFWSWLRPDGLYAYAAVIHDYLYWTQNRPKEEADQILRFVMEEFSVPKMQVYAIYGAVSLFGHSAWDESSKAKNAGEGRILKELPDSSTVTWEKYRKMPGVFAPQ